MHSIYNWPLSTVWLEFEKGDFFRSPLMGIKCPSGSALAPLASPPLGSYWHIFYRTPPVLTSDPDTVTIISADAFASSSVNDDQRLCSES